ncbi:MAG TPA: hypothetical protein VGN69_06515 [Solirubrobacteraceae bacterium]|nr:hypothetical protein [Solirubrobacteraceae bacterium]
MKLRSLLVVLAFSLLTVGTTGDAWARGKHHPRVRHHRSSSHVVHHRVRHRPGTTHRTGDPATAPSSASRSVFSQIVTAISQQAPIIAQPVLARAVAAGTLTQAQADTIAAALSHAGNLDDLRHQLERASAAQRRVLQDVLAAVGAQAPTIAQPILATAVSSGVLTQAQADKLASLLTHLAGGGSPPPVTPGLPPPPAPPPGLSALMHQILGAVAAQAPSIAQPLLAQAVATGALTQAQADAIAAVLAHAGNLDDLRHQLENATVAQREALHGILAAVAAQVPGIAAPILAAAVSSGALTQAQADRIASLLSHASLGAGAPRA